MVNYRNLIRLILVLVGGVFYFLSILMWGYISIYNPVSYAELVQGLGRTESLFVISLVFAGEYAASALVLVALVFPFLLLLAGSGARVSGLWLVVGLVVVWSYYAGQPLVIALSNKSGFVVVSHLSQILVPAGILLAGWLLAGHARKRLTRQPSPTH